MLFSSVQSVLNVINGPQEIEIGRNRGLEIKK